MEWPNQRQKRHFKGYNGQKRVKTGICFVGYAPNYRPPVPPPLSVTPLILALRTPIRHKFRGRTDAQQLDFWLPSCLYGRNDRGVREKRVRKREEKEWVAEK